jgi:2-methylisocitrate lyase-like PEP mutase family enzyme
MVSESHHAKAAAVRSLHEDEIFVLPKNPDHERTHIVSESQHAKAAALRALHEDGIFVLPNAWDAGSAAMIAAAGAQAIATTSAGVSWSLGRPDGQNLSRHEAVDVIARIANTVDLPVTADVEGGYGSDPDAVAATVAAVIGAGAVGINLEDSGVPDGGLFDAVAQAARIRAARAAAIDAELPELMINARTDVFLFEIGKPEGRLDDVLARAAAYAEAGADSLFVPGVLDLGLLATLTSQVSLPVNVMAGPGAPDVTTLRAAGVRRVSLGQAITQAAYTLARKAAAEVLTAGTYDSLAGADSFGDINGAFPLR